MTFHDTTLKSYNFSKLYHEKSYDKNSGVIMIEPDGQEICNFVCCKLLENAFSEKLTHLETPKQAHSKMKTIC